MHCFKSFQINKSQRAVRSVSVVRHSEAFSTNYKLYKSPNLFGEAKGDANPSVIVRLELPLLIIEIHLSFLNAPDEQHRQCGFFLIF